LESKPEERIELWAVKIATRYFEKRGYVVENVSTHKRTAKHKGFDLLVSKVSKKLKIEVKECSRAWQIPDLYHTEVNGKGNLIANFLRVVYFVEITRPKLCLIPRRFFAPGILRKGVDTGSRARRRRKLSCWCIQRKPISLKSEYGPESCFHATSFIGTIFSSVFPIFRRAIAVS
jgi:hypothetical protein